MKTHLFAFTLLASTLMMTLPAPRAFAQTQQAMNREAAADFDKADAKLNVVYKKVIATLDEEGKKLLIKAQKAWLAFRDAQSEFAADEMRGGSAAPLLLYGTKASITDARVKELEEYLDNQKNR